jgi:pimeloyl-ACP methyl ester carboxylesterase
MNRVLAGALVLSSLSVTQSGQSQGTYTTYISGQAIATENYSIQKNDDATIRAEAELILGGTRQKTRTILSAKGGVSLSVESGGVKAVFVEANGSSAKVQLAGQPEREFNSRAGLVLQRLVWHHYALLLSKYDEAKGGEQRFAVISPDREGDVTVRVERVNRAEFAAGDKKIAAAYYKVVLAERVSIDIWADEMRVPVLILIESQGVRVVRQGSESLVASILASRSKPAAEQAYTAEEISYASGDVTIAGTLTIPNNGAASHPAVVLISGSGSQNRDGYPAAQGLYKFIAEHLSSNGVAVLRSDDRGMGKSTESSKPISYTDLIGDGKAAVKFLRARKDIDPDRVVLAGHSEGAGTAAIIASEDKQIAAIALLAGVSRTFDEVAIEQGLYQAALKKLIDSSKADDLPEDTRLVLKVIEEAKAGKKDVAASDTYTYFRQHLAGRPAAVLKQVRCPVLILQGERDTEVLAYHAIEMARALTGAGNRAVRLRIFPNLSHSFIPSPLDGSLTVEQRSRVSRDFLETLGGWLSEIVPVKQKARR